MKPIEQGERYGTGCLLAVIGIFLIIAIPIALPAYGDFSWFFLSLPLGIAFILVGVNKARWLECSECGTRLAGKSVKICPACKDVNETLSN